MPGMRTKPLRWTGIAGAALAGLCCATPILAVLLAAAGLSALTGYLDYVLLPAIVIFIAIAVYGITRRAAA